MNLDDLAERTDPIPMSRCQWCEREYSRPLSKAKSWQLFCCVFCEDASTVAEASRD